MSPEEELHALRQKKQELRAKLAEVGGALLQMTQRVAELEARLAKDSHNSHLPLSSDRFARQPRTQSQRKRSGKKPGGQVGHDGHHLAFSSAPDEVVVHPAERGVHCQADLRAVAARTIERRQVVDVPPMRLLVTEHQAERKYCPHCLAETRAGFPSSVSAPVQYGTGLGALMVHLAMHHLLPFQRTAEILSDVLGARMSEGTIRQLIRRGARVLQPVERQIKVALRQAPVIHQDESGLYVTGKRVWMHVTSTSKLTHHQVHAKRGCGALDANGILPGYQGTSVHDDWAAYEGYGCSRALCNVHLLRELIFLKETTQQAWTRAMQHLLLALKRLTDQAKARGQMGLSSALWEKAVRRYQQLLQQGEQAISPPSENQAKRRGRRKQSPARNLLDRLTKHEDAVLAFVHDLRVPFDNLQTERDIHMLRVNRKSLAVFAVGLGLGIFAAFEAIFPPCASREPLCLLLCNWLWMALLPFPLSRADLNSYYN